VPGLSLPFFPFISFPPLASSCISPFGNFKAKLKLSQSIVVVLQATQNAIVLPKHFKFHSIVLLNYSGCKCFLPYFNYTIDY
jgi:hypothetical protein